MGQRHAAAENAGSCASRHALPGRATPGASPVYSRRNGVLCRVEPTAEFWFRSDDAADGGSYRRYAATGQRCACLAEYAAHVSLRAQGRRRAGRAVAAAARRAKTPGVAAGKSAEGNGTSGRASTAIEEERATAHRIQGTGSAGRHRAKGGSHAGGCAGGQGRQREARLRGRSGSHHTEDAIPCNRDFAGTSGRLGTYGGR